MYVTLKDNILYLFAPFSASKYGLIHWVTKDRYIEKEISRNFEFQIRKNLIKFFTVSIKKTSEAKDCDFFMI